MGRKWDAVSLTYVHASVCLLDHLRRVKRAQLDLLVYVVVLRSLIERAEIAAKRSVLLFGTV